MAKSRRSGGYFGNTAGESEGSGTSGAIDTEMTVSENSSIPTRKSIDLNSSCRGAFGVSAHVVPLSRMSPFERKGLARRLRSELEQIQQLQKRIELQRTSGVTLSASSDILSCSNGNKGRRVENSRKPSMSSSVPGGISKPGGNSQKARGLNRGSTGKIETARRTSLPSSANALLMKECDSVLKRLMKHQHAWVFNTPVDVVKLNLPDYFSIIKHPMDLGTVKSKLAAGAYKEPSEFADDVRLTFSNAMTYNPPGNDVHIMADTLNKYFEMRWKAIEKKLPRSDALPLPAKPDTCEEVKTTRPMPPSKKRKISSLPPEPDVMPPARQVMSDQEKHNLGQQLESLMAEIPVHIIDFLKEHSSNGRDCGEDEIEIDIDDLSDDTLFTLRRLLDEFLQEKQKSKAKVEACEIEVLNDSGPSNSSLQPFKGNDPADEEVDIGGNDPPVSSYPHVEVEKDLTCRVNKSLSPGSSSDSGSSSSSDGESDDIKASPTNGAKVPENMGSQAQLDEKTRASDTPNRNQSVSGLDQLDDNSQHKPISFDSDFLQEGDSGPAERQVSPDKLYRAAVLKKRFLDTILKAREKTLTQGEKGDPEKLRQEREKLEMEQRREKARLQAEAKAAEDARKQAEAEAAAEARRKRELEREAARQALHQMEKTVEINENSRFLKDLEMLRAESAQQLPSPVDETSPDRSQDGLGSFKFGSSNPLEQLGLYMKADDEEEEGEPPCFQNPQNDVQKEEGEPPCIQNPQNDVEEEEGELPCIPNRQNDVQEEEGELPCIQNPQNDVEEEEGEPPCIQNPQNDVEEEEGEPPGIQNPQNDVEEEEGEPPGIQNPQNDVEEMEGEPPCIQNPQNDVEEEGEPPCIKNPQNDVEEMEEEPLCIQNPQNDVEEKEKEPLCIQDPQNDVEEKEREPLCIQNPQNDVEEEEGELPCIQNPQNDVEEMEEEPPCIQNPQNDVVEEEGVPPCIQNPQNDVEEEEGEPSCTQDPQNDVEEVEGELPCIQNPQNDVEEEEGELPCIQNPQNDVEEMEEEPPCIQNPQNDVVEAEGAPPCIQNPQNDVEAEGAPPCIQNPQNDVEAEEGEPLCIQNPQNDVEEEEGEPPRIQNLQNVVEEGEGEPPCIQNPQNDVEEVEID
ncbi:transcription factor GTE8-like [Lotus japonicus]|uniref:transcription factor GTE8-like n=1 Tax=Lotus japonicus TaxID=34305 RepID=UPI0025886841|nr:transcription factor GTE8-like [Lotus japonicus]